MHLCTYIYINLTCLFLAITVMFSDTTYSVDENAGPARPVLVLSNPASMTFAVQVTNTDGSATGGSTIGEYCRTRQAPPYGINSKSVFLLTSHVIPCIAK